jgi:HD-GYP domain-containing protein (c-di-GMP phosphodiesterase class II)
MSNPPASRRGLPHNELLQLAWGALGGLMLGASAIGGSVLAFPTLLFWFVVVAASLCVFASLATLRVAITDGLPELGLLASYSFALSALPLVHGVTTPGVLFEMNPATMSSVLWATPIASFSILPLLFPRRAWSRKCQSAWRPLALVHIYVVTALCIGLLLRPSLLPAFAMRSYGAVAVAVFSIAVSLGLSLRHVRLARIANAPGPLIVACGFVLTGISNLVWIAPGPFSAAFWLAHVLDISGVFVLTIVSMRAYHQRASLRAILKPVIAQTPLSALALGLEPIVHRFVASLEKKDPITRDHVVRTAVMAMRVGERLNLAPDALHNLGLGALLHDLGKLSVPDEILHKPSRLSDDEFTVMKRHTVYGEQMVAASVTLKPICSIVRGHHERIDGHGYPDALRGDQIPLEARIVSVCDAYDAMANTRQYRDGMGRDKAISILREHSGSQWDPRVVEALVATVLSEDLDSIQLDGVGRTPLTLDEHVHEAFCGCLDAIPKELADSFAKTHT